MRRPNDGGREKRPGRIKNVKIVNARENNLSEYHEAIHEAAYWERRESIEKNAFGHIASARTKLRVHTEREQVDAFKSDKESK